MIRGAAIHTRTRPLSPACPKQVLGPLKPYPALTAGAPETCSRTRDPYPDPAIIAGAPETCSRTVSPPQPPKHGAGKRAPRRRRKSPFIFSDSVVFPCYLKILCAIFLSCTFMSSFSGNSVSPIALTGYCLTSSRLPSSISMMILFLPDHSVLQPFLSLMIR